MARTPDPSGTSYEVTCLITSNSAEPVAESAGAARKDAQPVTAHPTRSSATVAAKAPLKTIGPKGGNG